MDNIFENCKSAAVIVAHPDDETLWCGGVMLTYRHINWTIFSLCRKSDPDRAPKFFKITSKYYNATAIMADLDDGPEQIPLAKAEIQQTIIDELAGKNFDLILTHNPKGEYTRHRRHEETSEAVFSLWKNGELTTKNLLMFAYEDGGGKYPPKPIKNADIMIPLAKNGLKNKRDIIIDMYGFSQDSFEAKAVSDIEAFWRVKNDK